MRLRSLFLLILLFIIRNAPILALAPPVPGNNWTAGGSGMDYPSKTLDLPGGETLILATVGSTNGTILGSHGSSDIWLAKTDGSGNLLWQSCFGGTAMDVSGSMVRLANGHILIAGYTASLNGNVTFNHGQFDAWLLETDANGQLLWQRTYGGSASDLLYTLTLAPNGDILLGGGTYSNDGDVTGQNGNQDFWLLRTDANGNLLWQRSLGGSNHEVCYGIAASAGGTIFACGGTNSTNGNVIGKRGAYDGWIVALDGQGNTEWSACIGGSQNESLSALVLNGSEMILAGYTGSNDGDVHGNHGATDGWLVRCDTSGNLIDTRCFGGSQGDALYAVSLADNNQLLAAGGTLSTDGDLRNGNGQEDAWVLRAGRNLDLLWSIALGGSAVDRACSIAPTTDDAFLLGAYSYSHDGLLNGNRGSSDIWVSRYACRHPNASIGLTIDTTCIGMPITLTNNSANAAATQWLANGLLFSTDTNTHYSSPVAGRISIDLVSATCALTDTAEDPLVFVSLDQPVITPTAMAICDGQPVNLEVYSPGTVVWNNGSTGAGITHAAAGDYQVTVNWHGCTAISAVFHLQERSAPVFSLGPDTTICDAASLVLTGPAGMSSYQWQDGSSGTAFTVVQAGIYSLTVSDGYCPATDLVEVQTRSCAMPVAGFTVNSQSACAGASLQFTNQSQLATACTWYFPGGQPAQSNDWNPVVAYTTPGVYSVMLLVQNAAGSNSRMEISFITVHAIPDAPVISSVGNQLISTPADQYQWMLNGLNLPGATQQSHFAMQEGNYQVLITNADGCVAVSEPFLFQSTGIRQQVAGRFEVYPNPAQDQFNLKLPEGIGPVRLLLRDLTGKTLLITDILDTEPAAVHRVTFPVGLSAGAYSVTVQTTDQQTVLTHFIIKN